MSKYVKRKAEHFIREYKLYDVNYISLKKAAAAMGYVVVEFDRSYNDENVEELLDALRIKKYAETSRGFTYADPDNRIVFVSRALNDYEKTVVLSHEIGHIYFKHFASGNIIGNDVIQEREANEFSHYLLEKSLKMRIYSNIHKNKKTAVMLVAAAAVLVLGITAVGVVHNQQKFYGEFYVTRTGQKYHKKECMFVRGKSDIHRLTKEEYESGNYQPCKMCLPE